MNATSQAQLRQVEKMRTLGQANLFGHEDSVRKLVPWWFNPTPGDQMLRYEAHKETAHYRANS